MESLHKSRPLILLVMAMCFLLLLLFYVYAIRPSDRKIAEKNDELARLDKQVELVLQKTEEKNETKSEYSQESVQAALPLSDNTEQMLLDLNSLGKSNGVSLENVTVSMQEGNGLQAMTGDTESPFPAVNELKISVALQGTYPSIVNWIAQLQRLPRLLVIDSFDLNKPKTEEALPKPISVNLMFTAYYDSSYRDMVDREILPFDE
ncbi:type 4a pilus biogenesis protein PilO [Cohnella lupini]|uniref:Type IV pilus assembly protein PilO n=1 Tax=Cohnella lupini TaxID=1294267 RepID=A0A3D9IIX2_9BACL|nr:type 4a pilus biogenesis protein PilO [Cohnella lupini]RED61700.1 type IV pilus assembly protein PilO [Cohnella lupini]